MRGGGGRRSGLAGGGDGAGGGGADDALGDHAGAALNDGTAGNGVVGVGGPDVEDDTGLVGGQELGASNAGEGGGARASDLKIDTLGVRLGAVGLAGGVQGQDLVAEDVVAGGDIGGDADGPLVVVLHQDVGGVGVRGLDETGAVNLEPAEAGLVGGGAVAVAAGEVVKDGTLVGLGPSSPLESDGVAGGDSDVALAGGGITVADDVGVAVSIRGDEAKIRLLSSPASTRKRRPC